MSRRGLALILIAVGAASTGCCPVRKGVVLRGDWSLELNRVPWRTGCDTSCYESSCDGPGHAGAGAVGGVEEIPTPAPAGAAHARFHVVPTRPVFGDPPMIDEPPAAARRSRSKQASSVLRSASRPVAKLEPTPADDELAAGPPPRVAARTAPKRTLPQAAESPEASIAAYVEPAAEPPAVRRSTPAPARRNRRDSSSPTFEPQWRARGSV